LGWRAIVSFAKSRVESPDASKAGGQRDFPHGEAAVVNQLLREMQTSSLRHRNRTRTQMLKKKPPQMPSANSKPLGQRFNASVL